MPLDWKLLIILAAIIVVAVGAAVVALLYGVRRLYRAVSAWADRRVEREVAAGLSQQWQVWDDEAEAGMSELQVQMLREGYVLLPEDSQQVTLSFDNGDARLTPTGPAYFPAPSDALIAADLSHRAQVQADPGVCAVLSGEPTSCRLCLPHRCEYSPAERPLSDGGAS